MTLLITNVRVIGGGKNLPEVADVYVNGDKISAIGSFGDKKTDEVLSGEGAYLSPGFIDVNTDSDHYLSIFDHPGQEDFLRQGVTTIVGGNCGASLAPLLYGSLESIQKWTDVRNMNVGWHTLEEFFSLIEKRQLGVNFMTLIGHSTVRRAMLGEAMRDLTSNELVVFGETLRRALKEGAAGFSTGLGYVHSRQTPYAEIKFLAKIVHEYGAVYATHLRNTGEGLGDSIEETIKIANETGARVVVSHLLPLKGFEKEYEAALDRIESLPRDADFHFDLYPFDTSVIPLYAFLPLWVQNGGIEVMMSNVKDSWLQPRIVKELPKVDPHGFVIAWASGDLTLSGRSLREMMDIYGLRDPQETLMRLMVSTSLRASIFYKNINPALITRGLLSKRSFVSSNAASLSDARKEEKLERAVSTFPKFLSLVLKEKLMPLEDAIKKVTQEPARKFNLRDRGEIREGNYADLACFTDEGHVKFTVVNGRVAFKDGTVQTILAGRPLRHHGY
ncbi:MAG: amidohydrolase family protein [Candidatus Liptonbacteria bacterium]|nr:amidohydrolase family protein [Candidatus Liptonbacteria bacterium]